jgi:hypothetical protein
MAEEEKKAADEVDDKAGAKVGIYFAKEHGFSLELAHDASESAKKLCEALNSFSSNQYFSQATARKWFGLAIKAEALKFRTEAAHARLSVISAKVETAVLKKEKPAADAAQVKALFIELEGILEDIAKANEEAQVLLAELSEDVKSR